MGCNEVPKNEENTQQPANIIFVLTDDQRWDAAGFTGNDIIRTPHMDKMAEEGVAFRNAYVVASVCSISRASILSGQYPRRHGIHDFATSFSDSALKKTYPLLLRDNGYKTGFIGKYGVGHDLPEDHFDYWKGFAGQGSYRSTDSLGNYQHLTTTMGDQAVEFIQSYAGENEPFALSVSFKAPHVESGDPRIFPFDSTYSDYYINDTIPLPETGSSEYFEKFPGEFRENNEARKRWKTRFSTPEKYQENVKSYYRLVSGVDDVLGRIRETLEQEGVDENTVIILTSDNGFYLGEHRLAGKWYGHEESIRVPFIYYDPQLEKNKRGVIREEMVLNVDVAPTILDRVGIDLPESMQGLSIMPLVNNEDVNWRQDFYYSHLLHLPPSYFIPHTEGIVTDDLKYMGYYTEEKGTIFEELYNIQEDPHEKNNLINNEQYNSALEKLKDRMQTYKKNHNCLR